MPTANLQLPFLAASQAQKHVTPNAAIGMLDALVQTAVVTRGLAAPPAAAEGQAFLVAAAATGAWAGHAGALAAFQDGAWAFLTPRPGWRLWIADEALFCVFDGSQWKSLPGERFARLGINAAADSVSRLTVSADASLFNHAGHGHQLKLNKSAAGDTASLLFQTGYGGRAEIGLAGNDDLAVKVSADGGTWRTALTVNAATGAVGLPNGLAAPLALAQGGTGAVSALGAQACLGLRYPLGTIAVNGMAELNLGAAVGGALLFLVPDAAGAPAGSLFARLAPSPQLVPIAIAGGTLGTYTTALAGSTGTNGRVNMAALDGGRVQVENRLTAAIGYTLYLFR